MSRCTITAVVALAILSCAGQAVGADKACSLQFIGEDGKPIPDAHFFLYDMTGGEFREARFRNHPLPAEACIELESLPAEFKLGVVSEKHFYDTFWNGSDCKLKPYNDEFPDVKLKPGPNTIRVEQTGTVSLTFSKVEAEITNRSGRQQGSEVIPYYRRASNGQWKRVGGIGVFVRAGQEYKIKGLLPGDYKFELKPDYASNDIYWSISDVAVRKRNVTEFKDLVALGVR